MCGTARPWDRLPEVLTNWWSVQLTGGNELARLTQEKTLNDVKQLLPSMLVGLDVNVRFHK